MLPALALSGLLPPLLPQDAGALTRCFAGAVTVVQNVTDEDGSLGTPDAVFTGMFGPAFEVPGDMILLQFTEEETHSSAGLASLLQVSEALLLAAAG
jgi:hypothetical protein